MGLDGWDCRCCDWLHRNSPIISVLPNKNRVQANNKQYRNKQRIKKPNSIQQTEISLKHKCILQSITSILRPSNSPQSSHLTPKITNKITHKNSNTKSKYSLKC